MWVLYMNYGQNQGIHETKKFNPTFAIKSELPNLIFTYISLICLYSALNKKAQRI